MTTRGAILVLLLAAAAAGNDSVDRIFDVWDADGNGVITRDELPDAKSFAKADADGDGRVTRAEVARFLGIGGDAAPAAPAKPGGKEPDAAKEGDAKSEARPVPEPRTLDERVEDFFRRYDTDKDRRIRREEFRAGDDELFAKYDRNRDEAWSEREVARYLKDWLREAKRRPTRENFLDLFDLDRDRKVTRREYDGPPDFFRDHDHDRDRVVTEQELTLGPEPRPGEAGETEPRDEPTREPARGLLARYDEDGDGRITLEELNNATTVLERLDDNGDGVLSGPEVR